MTPFEFATATRIIFGTGTLNQIGVLAADMGRRAFVVTGSDPTRAADLLDLLTAESIITRLYPVAGEPTIEMIREGVELARGSDLVIGFGGGSVIDAGKAIAILLTNGGDPLDYLEIIGRGQPLTHPGVPYIAIPTTAGTGAEVTRNAVLGSSEHRAKASLRSPLMLPRLALIDPNLTSTLPPHITASSGLDALTQVIEPFVSNRANPITDALCRDGISRAGGAIFQAWQGDLAAREAMALVALFSGLALANARLGAVHGFAGPIGGMFPNAPHGAICAALLPHVMAMNLRALRARNPHHEAIHRYDAIGLMLTDSEIAEAGIGWVREICAALNVPSLRNYGLTESDFPAIIEKAGVASSMQGNPIKLEAQEMHEILVAAW